MILRWRPEKLIFFPVSETGFLFSETLDKEQSLCWHDGVPGTEQFTFYFLNSDGTLNFQCRNVQI